MQSNIFCCNKVIPKQLLEKKGMQYLSAVCSMSLKKTWGSWTSGGQNKKWQSLQKEGFLRETGSKGWYIPNYTGPVSGNRSCGVMIQPWNFLAQISLFWGIFFLFFIFVDFADTKTTRKHLIGSDWFILSMKMIPNTLPIHQKYIWLEKIHSGTLSVIDWP